MSAYMRSGLRVLAACLVAVMTTSVAAGAEPVDRELIPEGRRLLEYLRSIEGKKIIMGKQRSGGGTGPFEQVLHITGREPALRGCDIAGFHPVGSELYHQVLRGAVADMNWWWLEKGGIVNVLYHCGNPMHPEGTAWKNRPKDSKPPDIGKMVAPGTEEYQKFHETLKYTADYLEQLAAARVPLLFAPLHEIDGGWFWWTDLETPENTAALYRQTFNYLVKERNIHNLIWVYHAAHVSWGPHRSQIKKEHNRTPTLEEEAEYRRRFYPGDEYVDIVSMSTYVSRDVYPDWGWGAGWEDARQGAYRLLQRIAPGKPLAINETPHPIHPLVAQQQKLAWLWSRVWFDAPADWQRYTYNHEHMITLDELPLLHDGNVAPNVRIEWPIDGLEAGCGEIDLAGFASDRNGDLESVRLYVLSQPWLEYSERDDRAIKEAFAGARLLGEARLAAAGRWTITWANPSTGFHQLVAMARDSQGLVAHSNVVRITVGLKNLARGKPASASIHQEPNEPTRAVDSDLYTGWWAGVPDKAKGPQWLQVDLESERTIGAVSVLWWKAYATDYTVQISRDAQTWHDVGQIEGRRGYWGDSDVILFQPVQARYVRLYCRKPSVTWQTYCVNDFGVYESIPE